MTYRFNIYYLDKDTDKLKSAHIRAHGREKAIAKFETMYPGCKVIEVH